MKTLREYLPEAFLAELGPETIDSASPISGSEEQYRDHRIVVGDEVAVKNMKYEGKVGKVLDIADNIATVAIEGVGKIKIHIADLEYNHSEEKDPNQAVNNLKKLAGL